MAMDAPVALAASEARLLIVEDDHDHCYVLQRAFEKRGYAVRSANSVPQALATLDDWRARYAVIDLRLPGASGLTLVPRLRGADPEMRIVVMTGYASIATAVEAIKLGAVHYLTKPVDASMIEAAFHHATGDANTPLRPQPVSVYRLAWEHIHGVLADHHGNISAAARALGMHRRTLQRKLGKFPSRL